MTHYTYDALNRVLTKSYTNDTANNTPAIAYTYDTEYAWQLVPGENHPKGHLNAVTESVGTTKLVTWTSNDYDERGRLMGYANCFATDAQSCPGTYTVAAYNFNLNEDPLGFAAEASGPTYTGLYVQINNGFDSAGRLSSLIASVSIDLANTLTSTAFSASSYFAGGEVKTANLAIDPGTQVPGITMTRTLDNRGRITGETDLGSKGNAAYNYTVKFDGTGGVTSYNDSVNGNWTTIKNDSVHRFSSSTGTINGVAASYQETYDDFGNRKNEVYTYNGVQNQPSAFHNFTAANNRIDSASYDNAGNLLSDGTNNYLYDAENRLCATEQASNGGDKIGYLYDPNGIRLTKAALTTFTCDMTKNGMLASGVPVFTNLYTAGPNGEQVLETDGSINLIHYNVFWNGNVLGTWAGTTLQQKGDPKIMKNKIVIYLIETNPDRAISFSAELAELARVKVVQSYADAQSASGGLDAVVIPLMSALEWGVIEPPALLGQTQVVKMPDYEVARGRPKYAIPGVSVSPDACLSPFETTRLVLRASLGAINRYNSVNPTELTNIGVPTVSLGLDKLHAGEAAELLTEELD